MAGKKVSPVPEAAVAAARARAEQARRQLQDTPAPSELLTAMAPDLEEAAVRRLHQWIQRDGASREEPLPLLLDATGAPHAWERAS